MSMTKRSLFSRVVALFLAVALLMGFSGIEIFADDTTNSPTLVSFEIGDVTTNNMTISATRLIASDLTFSTSITAGYYICKASDDPGLTDVSNTDGTGVLDQTTAVTLSSAYEIIYGCNSSMEEKTETSISVLGLTPDTEYVLYTAAKYSENSVQEVQRLTFKTEANEAFEDGEYIVPIYSINWNRETVDNNDNLTVNFYPRALLTVSEGRYTVKLKLCSASNFSKIWMLDQQLNYNYQKSTDVLKKAYGTDVKSSIEELNGGSDWLNSKKSKSWKFSEAGNGNFLELDKTDYIAETDEAYISVNLDDYKGKFYLFAWDDNSTANAETGEVSPSGAGVAYTMAIDTDNAVSVDDLKNRLWSGNISASIAKGIYDKQTSNSYNSTYADFTSLLTDVEVEEYNEEENTCKLSAAFKTDSLDGSPITSFSRIVSKEITLNNKSYQYMATYGDSLYTTDSERITIDFDFDDLVYGILVKADTEATVYEGDDLASDTNKHFFGILQFELEEVVDVTLYDENDTGIYVTGLSDVLPKNAIFTVEEDRAYTEYPDDNEHKYIRDGIVEWSGTMYNEPKHWFYITLTDINGNKLPTYAGITIHVPMEKSDETDDPSTYYMCAFNSAGGVFYTYSGTDNPNVVDVEKTNDNGTTETVTEFQYEGQPLINLNHSTFAYMQEGDYVNLYRMVKSGDDDGIYTASAQLQKFGTNGSSMANAAFDSDVMITINDGVAKLYFTSDYLTIMSAKAYIGELMCYDTSTTGKWYEDSVIYTNYLVDDDGNLVSNCGYDVYTDCGCVKGGIITLMDESYDEEFSTYDLAIVPPAMLGGADYSTLDKTELTVHLRFTDVKKVADYSDENVETEVMTKYGFDKSALLREIGISELEDEDLYTSESYSVLTDAIEIAQTVYDNEKSTSANYEEQIYNLRNAVAQLVIDESAVGDKTELQALVEEAKKLSADDYTNSSFANLESAIATAENVLAKDAVKQSKIDEAKENLQNAIDALTEKVKTTLDKDNLPDGKYQLYAQMIKTDRESYSMSNNGINHTVQLEVIDGEYYLTVQFKGLAIYNQFGYLQKLGYYDAGYTYDEYGYPQGEVIDAEVLTTYDVIDEYNDADNLYPETLKIKLVDKASADYVPLQVFVPIMEAISEGSGTQDVLMQLDWTTLVATNADLELEEPDEQSPALDYTDEATGVEIHADKGVFAEGVSAIVTEITEGDDYTSAAELVKSEADKFKLYDISFEDKDGVEAEPNGKITISIPVPDDYTNAVVYRITDGAKTLIKGEIKDGMYVFTSMTAGKYLIENKTSDDSSQVDSTNSDSSNNNSTESDNSSSSTTSGNSSAGNGNTDTTANPKTGAASGMATASAVIATALIVVGKRKKGE